MPLATSITSMRNSIKPRPIRGLAVETAVLRLYESIRELQQLPFLQRAWSYKQNLAFPGTSATVVEHGLGRTPVGFLVIDSNNTLLTRTGDWTPTTVELTNAVGAGSASILFF